MGQVTERALSFGVVAAAYERFRPGYPGTLVDEVLAYAQAPVRSALEIGAGTGKATRVFAARGIEVTATDPDAAMLAELRNHVPSSVTVLQTPLEGLNPSHTFDLVFAGAAMHWTAPHHRWLRVSSMLNQRGVFAAFGGQMHLDDAVIDAAVRTVREQFLSDDGVPSPDETSENSPLQWPGTELSRSDEFTDVRQITIERRVVMTAGDYLGHLSTISAYRQLPDEVRQQAFDRIGGVLPATVALNADVVLHLARVVKR